MDWNKLKSFYHVSNILSISEAAKLMNISQPALSRQITHLEQRLGYALFFRTSRGLVLTDEGVILYESVEKMFKEAERAQTQIQELSDFPAGKVRIATTIALGENWLPHYVPKFLNIYPHVQLDIVASEKEFDLQTKEADVAIRTYMEDKPYLIQEYLTSFHLGLYASESYLKEYGSPTSLEDLDQHRLLAFGDQDTDTTNEVNWILEAGTSSATREPYLSVNTHFGLIRMAEAGAGIASVPKEYAAEHHAFTNLVPVLPHLQGPVVDVYYSYLEDCKGIKRIQTLKNFLKQKMGPSQPQVAPKEKRQKPDIKIQHVEEPAYLKTG